MSSRSTKNLWILQANSVSDNYFSCLISFIIGWSASRVNTMGFSKVKNNKSKNLIAFTGFFIIVVITLSREERCKTS